MSLGTMSYSRALENADKLEKSSNNLKTLFEELKSEMDSLESVLRSGTGNRLYDEYTKLAARIPAFPEKVDTFSRFIVKSVSDYQAADNQGMSEIG